jgi:ubiquinone/menaquinone biosynthesis C-methylase UbiE
MSATDTVFTGSIPAIYDRYMVPLIFAPYAALLADRARALAPSRILETAAGTGVVTEALHRALPGTDIVATDLNPPMLDQAALRVGAAKVRFQQADALDLLFDEGSFDLVVCQFGVMFFPDKVKGHAEARRVLRDGGRYLFATWDKVERNIATKAAGAAVAELFPSAAAAFYERIPFRYHDRATIEDDLHGAGFVDIKFETVELRSHSASAREAAIGLTQGTPMRAEIEALGPGMLDRATDAAAEALRQFEGAGGFDAPMSAHIVTATK